MERTERTVTELASLFRMIQVIPDADSVGRVYEMLLAFCTTWRTIGVERAVLLLVDSREGVLRGRLGCERPARESTAAREAESFEAMAREVFDAAEGLAQSRLTLRAQAFSVPLDWTRSGVVKAATSEFPVLADRSTSEFATDPFFDAFDVDRYLAVPVRAHGRVLAVLAADNGERGIGVDDVSLVYSLAQQAALAVERIVDDADHRRTLRVLRKVQTILRDARTEEALSEGLNLVLTMVARSVGGSGALLRDFVRNRTLHIRTVDEYTAEAGPDEVAVGEAMEAVLDRCAGTLRPVHGGRDHPLVARADATTLSAFYAAPLVADGDGLGALAVYAEHDRGALAARRRTVVDLCAGMIAARLDALHHARRLARAETLLEEVRSNLVRERDASRAREHAMEYARSMRAALEALGEALEVDDPATARRRARAALEAALADAREYEQRVEAANASLEMIDFFGLVRQAADPWAAELREREVEVTVRVPRRPEWLLMNRENVRRAVDAILRAVSASVLERDRVLLECSARDDRVALLVADTGPGMPGDLLGRLIMPFAGAGDDGGERGAMSVAGDILRRHGGEISVRSSPSWRTILVVTFPRAANRDRRRARRDRRRRGDRRRARNDADGS